MKLSIRRSGLGSLLAGGRQQRVTTQAVGEEIPSHDSLSEHVVDEHPPTPVPEPELPAPEPAPPAPEPEPPTPEPGPPPQLVAVAQSKPELDRERVPEQAPDLVAQLPLRGGEPREWNVWELERLAREAEGRDPAHYQELVFLLLELRQFAHADGQLPVSFDPVVRDSFGGLLYSVV